MVLVQHLLDVATGARIPGFVYYSTMKEIQLTQGKVALVDDEDFDFLSAYKWCANKSKSGVWYAIIRGIKKGGKTRTVFLHRVILDAPKEMEVDHKDGNGLNNQRANLRLVTRSQNKQGFKKSKVGRHFSSIYRGVAWNKAGNCWTAYIKKNNKRQHLGCFVKEALAALAFDSSAIRMFGEFAQLNFPEYPHVLRGTKAYLIGYMEAKNGQGWRDKIIYELRHLGITFFSPYDKPFVIDIPETTEAHKQLVDWRQQGKFDKVAKRMREIRASDLRLVDLSDWLIAYIDPDIVTYGTIEELTTAVREKKPVFIIVEGGRKKTPLWVLGMLPHKYIYDSVDDVIETIKGIDCKKIELSSDRWKLLRPELR